MAAEPPELLRAQLLSGVNVAVAAEPGPPAGSAAQAVSRAAAALGAAVAEVPLTSGAEGPERQQAAHEAALGAAIAKLGALQALVVDAGSLFAAAEGREKMLASVAASWNAVRAAAQLAFLKEADGGRILLLAPADDGGDHARATAAGLENMARTLSIEWARHRITSVAIAPGKATTTAELAALACWLLSPAGAYFSGCLMDLRGQRHAT